MIMLTIMFHNGVVIITKKVKTPHCTDNMSIAPQCQGVSFFFQN